jgi:hypothetical protein
MQWKWGGAMAVFHAFRFKDHSNHRLEARSAAEAFAKVNPNGFTDLQTQRGIAGIVWELRGPRTLKTVFYKTE